MCSTSSRKNACRRWSAVSQQLVGIFAFFGCRCGVCIAGPPRSARRPSHSCWMDSQHSAMSAQLPPPTRGRCGAPHPSQPGACMHLPHPVCLCHPCHSFFRTNISSSAAHSSWGTDQRRQDSILGCRRRQRSHWLEAMAGFLKSCSASCNAGVRQRRRQRQRRRRSCSTGAACCNRRRMRSPQPARRL